MKYLTSTILVLLASLYSFSTLHAACTSEEEQSENRRIRLERIDGIIATLKQCEKLNKNMSCNTLFQLLLDSVHEIDAKSATEHRRWERTRFLNTCFYCFFAKEETRDNSLATFLDHANSAKQNLINAAQRTKSSPLENAAEKTTVAMKTKMDHIDLVILVLTNFQQHNATMQLSELHSLVQLNIEQNTNVDDTDGQAAYNLAAFTYTQAFLSENENEQTIDALLARAHSEKESIADEAQMLTATLMAAMMHS